jgi:hypothetical protein
VTFGKRMSALAAAATLTMLGGVTPADAATYSPMDGHYAYEFGCRADQQVIYHKVLYNGGGTALGYIDLMYSVNCHTAWAHAHSVSATSETWALYAIIHRNRDDRQEVDLVKNGGHDAYSEMLYDKGMTSYAQIIIDPNGCCGVEYQTKTSSY